MNKKVCFVLTADGVNSDIRLVIENLETEYPEFKEDKGMQQLSYFIGMVKCVFFGTWSGDINDFKRLSHHAEGLYKDTELENVHVDIYVGN